MSKKSKARYSGSLSPSGVSPQHKKHKTSPERLTELIAIFEEPTRKSSRRNIIDKAAQKTAPNYKYQAYAVNKWEAGPGEAHWNCSCNRPIRKSISTAGAFKCDFCCKNYGHYKCYKYDHSQDFKVCFECREIKSEIDRALDEQTKSIQETESIQETDEETATDLQEDTDKFPDLQALPVGPCAELFAKIYDKISVKNVHIVQVGDKKELFIEYKQFEPVEVDFQYIYVKDKLIHISRYDDETATRKQGFRLPGCGDAFAKLLMNEKYKDKIPTHITYVDNNKKRFNDKSGDCILEMYCSNAECGIFTMDENEVIKLYGVNPKVSKLQSKMTKENIFKAKEKYENNKKNNIDEEVYIPAELKFPKACLHRGYMDKKYMLVRPFRRNYYHKGKKEKIDLSKDNYSIQTEQLKQISQPMRQHGNLLNVQTYKTIQAAKQAQKKEEMGRYSDDVRTEIDAQQVKYYKQNIRYFKRSLTDPKDWLKNRAEMRVMNSLHYRNSLPLEYQVSSPIVHHKWYKIWKKIKTPTIIYMDWTSELLRKLKRKQLMKGPVADILEIGDNVGKSKQLVICTDYDEQFDRRDGGGNIHLSETAAEVPNLVVVKNSISLLEEQYSVLFNVHFYDTADGFMSDDDPTIVPAIVRYLKGEETEYVDYIWSVWTLFKENKLKEKGKDIMLCIYHNNGNTPRRILRNLKGSGVTRTDMAKRITMDLKIWQFVENLEFSLEDSYTNYAKCVVMAKAYNWFTQITTLKAGQKYAFYDDGTTPWDDMKELEDMINEIMHDEKETESVSDVSMMKYIENLLDNDGDFQIDDSVTREHMTCTSCGDIIFADIDSKISGKFVWLTCPGCKHGNYTFAGESDRLIVASLHAGAQDVRNIFSKIIFSKKKLQNGKIQISGYWSEPIGVSIKIVVDEFNLNFPNPGLCKEIKTSVAKLFLLVLVAPCARSKVYSTGVHTKKTNAAVEVTIQDIKRSKSKPVIQEYGPSTLKFMMKRAERFDLASDIPNKASPKARIQKETAWDKNPKEDKELKRNLDCVKRRFALDSMKEVCCRLREDLGCTFVTTKWIQKALKRKDVTDVNRKNLMNIIENLLTQRIKSNMKSKIHHEIVKESSVQNKFITIDLRDQVSKIQNKKPAQHHWIKLCRFEVENTSKTDSFTVDLNKTSTVQQSLPYHTLACAIHSLHANHLMALCMNGIFSILSEIGSVQIDSVASHQYREDALNCFAKFSNDLNDETTIKEFAAKTNRYLLDFHKQTTQTNLKRLKAIQNMSSLDMEILIKDENEFGELKLIVVLDHISQIEKSMKDIDVVKRYFDPMYKALKDMGVTVPYSMNTQERGAHWIPQILMETGEKGDEYNCDCRLSIMMTDSNDSKISEPTQIALTKRYVNSFVMGYGLIAAKRPLGEVCKSLSTIYQCLKAMDYEDIDEELQQIVGDDLNQLLNFKSDWMFQSMELFIDIGVEKNFENDVIKISQHIAEFIGQQTVDTANSDEEKQCLKVFEVEIYAAVISLNLICHFEYESVNKWRENVTKAAYSLEFYLDADSSSVRYKKTIEFLKSRYRTLTELCVAWNIRCRTWNALPYTLERMEQKTEQYLKDNKSFMEFVVANKSRIGTIPSVEYSMVMYKLDLLDAETSNKIKEKCLQKIQNQIISINTENIASTIRCLERGLKHEIESNINKALKFISNTEVLICGRFDGDGRIDEIELQLWEDDLQANKVLIQHLIEVVKNKAFDIGFEAIKSQFTFH
eukprot:457866_1